MINNRKRVTLTFEIDDHDGYNDEAFMRNDFLQELSCCVNDPYEDTFVMKVEDADVPQEMTARELLHIAYRMFQEDLDEYDEYDRYALTGRVGNAVQFVVKWALEHPEEG